MYTVVIELKVILFYYTDVPVQVASINIAGSTTNLDELFFSWLNHEVDYQARRRIQSVRRQGSTLNQSASLTTPRKSKSYARGKIKVFV